MLIKKEFGWDGFTRKEVSALKVSNSLFILYSLLIILIYPV